MTIALQVFITAVLILGAAVAFILAIALIAYIAAAVTGLVMLWRQARGDYEPDEETGDED